jgi:ABC-type multidrug transport system ATPase subunit
VALNRAAASAVLRVDGLGYAYPARPALGPWTATVGPGVTWLRGRNGSGKSTLLKLLAGVLPPLCGSAQAAGVRLADQPLIYRRQVFWCGPGAPVFDHLTPDEFFAFMRGLFATWQPADEQDAVAGLSLQDITRRRLQELSTGTQRKVWLAAACAVGCPVVLLDEPLNALDPPSLQWLLVRLQRAAAGPQAWLVASHQPPKPPGVDCALIDLSAA